jgi:hypothetical protein
MISQLFQNLALRWRNENALSDMTWAMAKSSETFRDILVTFFQFKLDRSYPTFVDDREKCIDVGRLDLSIVNGPHFFIIENKIYDSDYHIPQYCETQRDGFEGLGLITNHTLDSKALQEAAQFSKCKAKTWLEFKKELEQQIANFSCEERPCIEAYLAYVQEVCSMVDIQRIDWTRLQSLHHFVNLVKQELEKLEYRKARFKVYRDGFWDGYSGQYYCLSIEGDEKPYYPWVGLSFKEKEPTIYFAFRKDWNSTLYEAWHGRDERRKMMKIVDESSPKEIQMVLAHKELVSFSQATLEGQRQLLTEFAKAVIDEIYNTQKPARSQTVGS